MFHTDNRNINFRKIALAAAILAGLTIALIRPVAAQTPPQYTVTDLGTLGGDSSTAYAINNPGHVTGNADYSTAIGPFTHAFFWTPTNGLLDLGDFSGDRNSFSFGYGINNLDHVVGQAADDDPTGGPPHIIHAFLWRGGSLQDLGTVGANELQSAAYAVNDSDHVVGLSNTNAGPYHAFYWTQSAGMIDLGTLAPDRPDALSVAYAINNSDQVAGVTYTPTGSHAFLWTASGGMQDLGSIAGGPLDTSQAYGINNNGIVVGTSAVSSTYGHAFSWTQAGGLQDLGASQSGYSVAYGINTPGQIVGNDGTSIYSGSAVLWQGGLEYDLNQYISTASGWSLNTAYSINDSGQIVGLGQHNLHYHAFLLTPIGQ